MAQVIDIANYFLVLDQQNDGDGISNLKLQKLVYYAQGFYAAINNGKSLFDAPIEAWTHGPVVPELYHRYKEHGRDHLPVPDAFDASCLSNQEAALIEDVHKAFGQFSAWKLRNMTHEEQPWKAHEEDASEISLHELSDYFESRLS